MSVILNHKLLCIVFIIVGVIILKYNIVINPFFDANIHWFKYFIKTINVIYIILRVILNFNECMINNRIILLRIQIRNFNEY